LYSSLSRFLSNFLAKNKPEAEEKFTSVSAVKLEGEKAEEKVPEEFKQLQSDLEKEFGEKISFWPYKGGKIPGTVELYGGYELPFYIDVIDDKKAVIRIRNGGSGFFADEKDDQEAKPIAEQFFDYCSTASKVLEKMESLEEKGLFVKTVNKSSGCVLWEPTFRCKIRLARSKSTNIEGYEVYAIQYDPYAGRMYFILSSRYDKILRQLHSGHLELNLGNSLFGVKKEYSIELFESIISKIESDYDKHDKKDYFETTVYDDLESYKNKDQA